MKSGKISIRLKFRKFIKKRFLIQLVLVALFILSLILLKPINTSQITSVQNPAQSYEEGILKFEAFKNQDDDKINPLCKSILLTHGRKVQKVLVIFHGYTNCPKQFDQFGQMFYEKGYNVLIPRIPHHGLSNRLTNDLSNLTADELARFGDRTIDIAYGLGDEIYVTGISAGGVMAAWVGQFRPVEKVVPIAPIFLYERPKILLTPLTNLALLVPEMYHFWSNDEKERSKGPQYAYPRYSQKAIAQVFLLGHSVFNASKVDKPKAKSAVFITIENDEAINNELPNDLSKAWEQKGINVSSYEFSKKDAPIHDIIDPNQEKQNIEYIYPILFSLIDKPLVDEPLQNR